jgi:hypothetical protein
MARRYDEFIPVTKRFGDLLPPPLLGTPTHLDPDFDQLTYGDQGQRGKRINSLLTPGDLLAFFAALRPVDGPARPLIYALIGLYVVEDIVPAKSVPKSRWAENAHTRRVPGDGDIVVRAKPGVSGRLRRASHRRAARPSIATTFSTLGRPRHQGRLHSPQREAARLHDAAKFYRWFLRRNRNWCGEQSHMRTACSS